MTAQHLPRQCRGKIIGPEMYPRRTGGSGDVRAVVDQHRDLERPDQAAGQSEYLHGGRGLEPHLHQRHPAPHRAHDGLQRVRQREDPVIGDQHQPQVSR